jgi:hypothetical protein
LSKAAAPAARRRRSRGGAARLLPGLLVLGLAAAAGLGWWLWPRDGEQVAAPTIAAPAPPTTAAVAAGPPTAGLTAPAASNQAATPGAVPPGGSFRPRIAIPQRRVDELLAGRATDWRLARQLGNPAVLIVEFPNLAEQGDALNRVAALVEKAGAPRDRVLTDAELHALMQSTGDNKQSFYQGHNYSADDLARFLNLAAAQGLALNPQEQRLARLLQEAGMLGQAEGRHVALGLQGLISFTATQPDDRSTPADEGVDAVRRESLLRHELSHGEYLTNAGYREHCRRFWRQQLTEAERGAFRRLLAGLQYDVRNEDLVINEMQAYLMHTADERAFNARQLGVTASQLASMRERFRRGWPQAR